MEEEDGQAADGADDPLEEEEARGRAPAVATALGICFSVLSTGNIF